MPLSETKLERRGGYDKLNPLMIKNFKPDKNRDYKKADGKGLNVLVKKNGSKLLQFQYRDPFSKKQKVLSFGVFPEVSLADARMLRDEARKKIRQNIDPSTEKKALKAANKESAANSFEAVALEWVIKRDKQNNRRLQRILKIHLLPYLGRFPIKEITPQQAWKTIERIEELGLKEEPKRARQYGDKIYCYAMNTGRCLHNPFMSLKSELKKHTTKHHSAITDPKKVGELMRAIEVYHGTPWVKAALKLSVLFFCRQNELRKMEWNEVNWEKRIIELPAAKMKMKKPHIIPLSDQALSILTDLKLHTGHSKYLFPNGHRPNRCMSPNTVRAALCSIGYTPDIMVAHGLRSTARTNLAQELGFPIEVIELQLAHEVRGPLGDTYNRTTYLPERKKMMQVYADWLEGLRLSTLKALGGVYA